MPHIDQPNKPFLGLRISIALHAMFLCMLAVMNNAHQAEVKPPQFVEVATIAVTPEPQSQLSAAPTQTQAQPQALSNPKSIPKKPLKPEKTKVKVKSRAPKETSTALAKMPEPDSHLIASPKQENTGSSLATTGGDRNSTGGVSSGGGIVSGSGTGSGGASSSQNLVVLSRVTPRYPPRAEARGIQGWVQVNITVSPAGTVSHARIADSNPKQIFDQAALEAIQRWRFKPAFKDGLPVGQEATLKLVFQHQSHR